jgi:hypothetical protein
MPIESCIRSIQSLADLPRLIAALGHEPLWEAVPEEGWNRQIPGRSRVMVIGKTGNMPWLAFESSMPEHAAGGLARRLSRRGRISMVLALNSVTRRLAIAVALEKLARLELDLDHPEPESLASVARLAGKPEGGPLAFAVQAADALAAEPVSRRFFREFRCTLDRVAAGLPGPMSQADRHALALLQLTRVLFLYFIQAKGWLGGRERFLSEEVDRCLSRGRRIHRDLLRPLFFGTLNQAPRQRSRIAASFGAVPYLNGGLFEPHELERRFRADLPDELWRLAFERLFERFHFTVAEGRSGSVAPDMLGRVFEGVMDPDLRHASGTFYTPADLVHKILDAALVALLSRRLGWGESEAERRLLDPEPAAAAILGSLTVLDPAVGSGAFLLGVLERLAGIGARNLSLSARKRAVLERNLFGVDLNPAAVRLAELRLWLAVVADDQSDQAQDVRPLPNLDCLIRQGDSLFDPIGPVALQPGEKAPHRRELAALRRELVSATGPAKRSLVRRLRIVEAEALEHSLIRAEQKHRGEISAVLRQARGADLFGQRRSIDRASRDALGLLRQRLQQVRQARRQLSRDRGLPWFHYQSHFADVFARGGFDLVLGNPPWLRSEEIPQGARQRLAGRYRWWRARAQRFGKGPDLSVAFLERGLELAAPGGVVAMLVPAKITSAGYGAVARHELASGVTLHALADLTREAKSEFDALVYPMAIVAGKTLPSEEHQVRTSLALGNGSRVRQSELRGGGPWILAADPLRRALSELRADHPRFGDRLMAPLGVKTGANRIFVEPPAELEAELIRRAIRGRDVRAFHCRGSIGLLWTHDGSGEPLRALPPRAAAYLRPYLGELRSRRDYRSGPPWTLFRVAPSLARHRVVWADLARQLTAAALTTRRDRKQIPLNSCYVAPVRRRLTAESLSAWLNSTWIRAAARIGAVPAASGFARFSAQTVARLPLPDSVLGDPELSRLARAGRAGLPVQDEVDAAAAKCLGLSPAAQNALRDFVQSHTPHRR